MKIQPTSIASETLRYIGHGQLESSPASTSVLHVVGHELDHVAEFRNDAIRDNADIRSIEMKIDYEFRDGKLVAVSGKTTATTQKKPERDFSKIGETESLEKKENSKVENTGEVAKNFKISLEEKNLHIRLGHLESELSKLENDNGYIDPEVKDIQGRKEEARRVELKEKKRELEIELANFRIKEQIEKSQEVLKDVQNDVQKNSFQFLKIQPPKKAGSLLDISV